MGNEEDRCPKELVLLLRSGADGVLACVTDGNSPGLAAVGVGPNRKKRETACALALVISACVHGGVSWTKGELEELEPDLPEVIDIASELFLELSDALTGAV